MYKSPSFSLQRITVDQVVEMGYLSVADNHLSYLLLQSSVRGAI